MKEYIYKEKSKIINMDNKRHNVIIPNKHSTIDALILETKDLNAWDSWANITNYHTLCMVLKKGKKEWETLYDGSTYSFKLCSVYECTVNMGLGIFSVLFELETKKVKDNFLKKQEIKELKERIKRDSIRLRKLEKR